MASERIGIMGGTFNPVHQGHIDMARAAAAQEKLSRVLFLPTGNPPHKREGLVDAEDRYRMAAAAIAQDDVLTPSRLDRGYFDPFAGEISTGAAVLHHRHGYAAGIAALAQL